MIEINNATHSRVDEQLLKRIGRQILAKEKKKADISVALVSPQRARQLNMTYRKKTYVPNVLSFSMKELGLGELILCPAKIRKDARKYGIVFEQELGRVFRHGLLHILGYTHKRMQKLEI